ncbi:MAG: type II toxin-antitoxin system RelE/ParE family toxin [Candidatus Thiosymbion ectosymbiont of Robbea hypermnestra]|nr:type II toxin-antitoxin system RelE/ParE family toxin [Candidatus Thiosymbion ectosymbiont of Robbea hypermnestra]
MIALFVHDDAKADLEALWRKEPQAAGRILVLLEQLEGDPDLLDRLTQHNYGARRSADFHVSKWQEHWRKGRDLWRLKIWDLENKGLRYRIVYAFEPGKLHYHVLAVAPREFNYDASHPISRRILRAYRAL